MEPGESVSEACEREVLEEASIRVQTTHLVAVYSNPHILLQYPDGNKWQLTILHFATFHPAHPPDHVLPTVRPDGLAGSLGRPSSTRRQEYIDSSETGFFFTLKIVC